MTNLSAKHSEKHVAPNESDINVFLLHRYLRKIQGVALNYLPQLNPHFDLSVVPAETAALHGKLVDLVKKGDDYAIIVSEVCVRALVKFRDEDKQHLPISTDVWQIIHNLIVQYLAALYRLDKVIHDQPVTEQAALKFAREKWLQHVVQAAQGQHCR